MGAPETLNNAVPILVMVLIAILGGTWLLSRNSSLEDSDRDDPEPPQPPRSDARSAVTSKPSILISYRREDSADIAGRITDRLVDRFGKTAVFKDVDSIPFGRDFREHLQKAVGRCDALLVIIGKQWCDASTHGKRRLDDPRDHLRIEIESALARNIPVIPVLVQGASMPEEELLPESLRSLTYRNAVPVRPDPDFNIDLDRLMRGMEAQFANSSAAS